MTAVEQTNLFTQIYYVSNESERFSSCKVGVALLYNSSLPTNVTASQNSNISHKKYVILNVKASLSKNVDERKICNFINAE